MGPSVITRIGPELMSWRRYSKGSAETLSLQDKAAQVNSSTKVLRAGGDKMHSVGNNLGSIDRSSDLKNRNTSAVCLTAQMWEGRGICKYETGSW